MLKYNLLKVGVLNFQRCKNNILINKQENNGEIKELKELIIEVITPFLIQTARITGVNE